MELVRTGNSHPDFIGLVRLLDLELNERYGTAQAQYNAHNAMDPLSTAIVGYLDNEPIACGCFKELDSQCIEIKRMFVKKAYRGRGVAREVLGYLEEWAAQTGYKTGRLETGRGQPEAIGLYQQAGYERIKNYGPYKDMENSICFEKGIG